MSVVSENHGGPDAPAIDLRHRCGCCGRSLVGEPYSTVQGADYCTSCMQAAATLGISVSHFRVQKFDFPVRPSYWPFQEYR